ncbi:hypothetical protein EVU96_25250 [Bacillus infantis]|uniref:hypothetical protein n=1 Tax=Bacillus infantis TaxID=324767 RepID=UPI00101D4FC7|nr:hypothetical protein [Bacillus infantis]RYI24995.1 hypothetical protein EVU96_25250 [Bacillus infantis]
MALMRRKRLPDGTFGELEKVFEGETDAEKVERLESENAQLAYDLLTKEFRLSEIEQVQSDIIYQLMMGGQA